MIMDLERWNKELEDHDLFQPIINDLPNFCETTHETDLENDTLLFCYCMLHTHSNSTHAAPVRLITPVLLQIEQQGPEKLQLLQQLQELQTKLAGGRGLGGTGISAENGRLGWAWCSSNVAILSSRGRSYQLLQSGQQKSKRPGRKRD